MIDADRTIREHSYDDELRNAAVDFDGPIHRNSKGFYDGTIYDDPVEGIAEALKELSQTYNIIMIIWGVTEGTKGPNQYGQDPLATPSAA